MSNGTSESVQHAPGSTGDAPPERWDRNHPTVVALSGFFTGMLFITVIPGGVAGVLRLLFTYKTAEELFPLVLLALLVPIGLVIAPRTRRFGAYMWLGMALTALVVLGVTSLVLYFMVRAN
jgi:4-amino-4-deoxy-L-arabinose transferase-like glycosyltransferase